MRAEEEEKEKDEEEEEEEEVEEEEENEVKSVSGNGVARGSFRGGLDLQDAERVYDVQRGRHGFKQSTFRDIAEEDEGVTTTFNLSDIERGLREKASHKPGMDTRILSDHDSKSFSKSSFSHLFSKLTNHVPTLSSSSSSSFRTTHQSMIAKCQNFVSKKLSKLVGLVVSEWVA